MAQDYTPARLPIAGQVVSVVLQMIAFGVLCICFSESCLFKNRGSLQKLIVASKKIIMAQELEEYYQCRKHHYNFWTLTSTALPPSIWLVLAIYVDSILFVLATSIIVQGLGINSSRAVCESGILLCLVFYATTKLLIYYFFVERAYIVRGIHKPRLETKLWLFNCLFMMLPYIVVIVINFVWRFTYIDDKGVCIVGMEMKAMLPLITFEVIVNVYLTLLFILPLRRKHTSILHPLPVPRNTSMLTWNSELYSYHNSANPRLHRMAFRSLIGSISTLATSVANMTVLMLLRGEPGWICLMCCNADILFCVLVLHWATSIDQPSSSTPTAPSCIRPPRAESGVRRIKQSTGLNTPTGLITCTDLAPEQALCSYAKNDVVHYQLEHTGKRLSAWPYNESPSWPATVKFPGSVTTDVRSSYVNQDATWSKSNNGRILRNSRNNTRDCDEVDLREVSVDSGSSEESNVERHHARDMWRSGTEDAWVVKKSISVARMV